MKIVTFAITGLFLYLTAAAAAAEISVEPVATGLNQPLAITNAGDSRLFITEQPGEIVILDGGHVLSTPFIDIRSLVSCCTERGLLSIAFHPHFRENGYVFVDYTNNRGDSVIARYTVSATDPNRLDTSTALILLTVAQPYPNHNGGQLQFGPDGYLYIGFGDGGSGGDPENRAQNLSMLLGKILRIDVDQPPYGIPPSNPFAQTANARPEIWAYGLRNPWRFSFDRQTEDMWIADVGQDHWEEINVRPAGDAGGENYGWRVTEGTHCFNPATGCSTAGITLPVFEYDHSQGCSITGGYRYRGPAEEPLRGTYVYGDYCSGTIWGLSQTAVGTWQSRVLLQTNFAISSFGEDVNGELYVCDLHGTLYRIHSTGSAPPRYRAARR